MKKRDLIVGGNSAWEIIDIVDGGRQVSVRLVAGEGAEIRDNVVPKELLVGKPLYRRVADLADVDVHRAATEIKRYVDLDKVSYFPRMWVEEFNNRYPPGSAVPDATVLLGWFANLMDAGVKRDASIKQEQRRERQKMASTVAKKAAQKKASYKEKPKKRIRQKAVK